MLLQDYMQSEILCFCNKLVLKGFFLFGWFLPSMLHHAEEIL